jgi:hypothetical protein
VIYTNMLNLSQNNPDVHHGLGTFASTDPDLLITFLNFATPEEAKSQLDELLGRDPALVTLSYDQQKNLFAAWWAHGDQDALADLLLGHTQLQISGWKFLAQHFASKQDFELASMTALRFSPPDITQPLLPDQVASIQSDHFNSQSNDPVEGIKLCRVQIQQGDLDGALDTISKLEQLKDCPRSIFYLKARVYVKKQLWEQAWDALQQLDKP